MTLGARVLDQTGAPISGAAVTWSSMDPTTATIDASTGLLRGVAGGEVVIEARSGTLSGDVSALVYYQVAQNEAKVRFRAARDEVWAGVEGWGFFADVLGSDQSDWSGLMLENAFDSRWLSVFLPGRLATGETRVGPTDLARFWEEPEAYPTEPFVLLDVYTTDDAELQYLSTDGRIELELVEVPERAGFREGWFRGRLIANLTDYAISGDRRERTITPLGHKATVYADFWTSLGHMALPSVSVEFAGGPYPGAVGVDWASFEEDFFEPGKGRFIFELEPPEGEGWGELSVHVPDLPEVGAWSLSRNNGNDCVAEVYFDEVSQLWCSESGELRVDFAMPPTADDLSGEVRGRINAAFRLQLDTGARMSVSGSFHVPWYSTGNGDASSTRANPPRRGAPFTTLLSQRAPGTVR
jgi:hypothetical protein